MRLHTKLIIMITPLLLLAGTLATYAALRRHYDTEMRQLITRLGEPEKNTRFCGTRSIEFTYADKRISGRALVYNAGQAGCCVEPIEMEFTGFTDADCEAWPLPFKKLSEHAAESAGDGQSKPHRHVIGAGFIEADLIRNPELLFRNYEVLRSGRETVASRETVVLIVKPLRPGRPQAKLSFDEERDILLRFEVILPSGDARFIGSFDRIDYDAPIPADVAEAIASHKAGEHGHHGAFSRETLSMDEALRRVRFNAALPEWLPAGFELCKAQVLSVGEVKAVHLLYTDGLAMFSIFEGDETVKTLVRLAGGPQPEGTPNPETKEPGKTLVTKSKFGPFEILDLKVGGTYIWVVGAVPTQELQDMIGSMKLAGKN